MVIPWGFESPLSHQKGTLVGPFFAYKKERSDTAMGIREILKGEQPNIFESIANFQNLGQFGEYSTEYALTNHNIEGNFVVLKNLYVPYQGRTAEIDLVMLHEKGLFVFESKNYSGTITGTLDCQKWKQTMKDWKKYYFYNPVWQNQTHIRALSAYLGIPEEAFRSYIVFAERCELEKVPADTERFCIVRQPDMLKKLRADLAESQVSLSETEIFSFKGKLEPLTRVSEAEKERHVEAIRERCPECGNALLLRKGRYGPFLGCSNYPKCKYTRDVK